MKMATLLYPITDKRYGEKVEWREVPQRGALNAARDLFTVGRIGGEIVPRVKGAPVVIRYSSGRARVVKG